MTILFGSTFRLDNNGSGGACTSIELDINNNSHICYYNYTNGNLKYAYFDGIRWDIETVNSNGDAAKYTSLALDNLGNPYISYYDATNGDLKYAYFNF